MGIVFDHEELVLVGNLSDRLHVRALPIKMNRNDSLCARRDGRFYFGGINAVRPGVAVDEHGGRFAQPNRFRSGEEGVGMGYHFVAGADAKGLQRQPDSIRSVAYADGVFGSVEGGKLLLEPLQDRSEHVLTALQNILDLGVDFSLDIVILARVAIECHGHFLVWHLSSPCPGA